MFLQDFAASDGRNSRRDAIDGFSAIAAALDQRLPASGDSNPSFVDFAAIGLGWMVLIAAILYPALQLAAIAVGAAYFCSRPLLRLLFGPQRKSAGSLQFGEAERQNIMLVA